MKKFNEILRQYAPSIVLGVIATSVSMIIISLITHLLYGRVIVPIVFNILVCLGNYLYCELVNKKNKDKNVTPYNVDLNSILMNIAASVTMMLFLLPLSYIK